MQHPIAEPTMTIGELARRSGVAVSTIRAWEQRYGLLTPTRSAGGHRRYSVEDLRRLGAVRSLADQGVTLSVAAERITADAEAQSRPRPRPYRRWIRASWPPPTGRHGRS